MLSNNAFFVLSYKRAERLQKNICTFDFLSDNWRDRTYVVVREEEWDAYEKVADSYGIKRLAIPKSAYEGREFFGWGETMDWIVDYAVERFDRFVIADDDLKLTQRPYLNERIWLGMTPDDFDEAMDCLMTVREEIPFMGLRERQFSIEHQDEYEDNVRFIHIFALHGKFFKDNPQFRYTTGDIRHMPDLQLLLSLLTAGVRNRAWNRYCHDDVPDAPGGCSVIRSPEEHSKSAIMLHRMFPELVKLRQKTNWGEPRIGTTIAWAKAFKPRKEE